MLDSSDFDAHMVQLEMIEMSLYTPSWQQPSKCSVIYTKPTLWQRFLRFFCENN